MNPLRSVVAVVALVAIGFGFYGIFTGRSKVAFIGYGIAVAGWLMLKFWKRSDAGSERDG